jgi:hypothetical protein
LAVTALDDRPRHRTGGVVSRAELYEERFFLGQVHCYRRDQLAADWPPMLLPWCEEDRPAPLRHERANIWTRRVLTAKWIDTCPRCGHLLREANQEAIRART